VRAGRRVVVLGLVREWLFRRAGFAGCDPVALDLETFPGCLPGPLFQVPAALASATRRA
jgi:hypothetical protein